MYPVGILSDANKSPTISRNRLLNHSAPSQSVASPTVFLAP
jgi:hypothetical protein